MSYKNLIGDYSLSHISELDSRLNRKRLVVGLLTAAMIEAPMAQQDVRISFNIPSQKASTALIALGEQADITVLVKHDARDVQLAQIRGMYTVEEAIKRLLRGSGLAYRINNSSIIVSLSAKGESLNSDRKNNIAYKHKSKPKSQVFTAISAALLSVLTPVTGTGQEAGNTSGLVLEEILVTAEKREISLEDAPLSVTALSPGELDNNNIKNLVDLSSHAPGLIVAKAEGFSRNVTIRGVGFETTQNGASIPGVSYHIDGVFIADANATNVDFVDVERVEVLRGPQGTVYGQNSTGGAINVITKKPDFDGLSGKAEFSYGNFDYLQARGGVNVPVSDAVSVRLSGTYVNHDGFSEIVGGSLDGYDLDEEDNFHLQGKLLWQPMDEFSALFTATHYESEVHDRAQRHIDDPSGDIRDLTQSHLGLFEIRSQLYSMTMEYDMSFATFKSVTGYNVVDMFNFLDNDRGIPVFVQQQTSESNRDTETLTQEFNLVSNGEGHLDWILGAFILDFDKFVFFESFLDRNRDGIPAPVHAERAFTTTAMINRNSWSVFGQGTYHLTDRWRLTGGIRYTDDELTSENCNFNRFVVPPAFCPAGPTGFEVSVTQVTGKADLQWEVSDDFLLYGSYTRGFKPGGSNLNSIPVLVDTTYTKETIDAFEFGAKGRFLDDRLRISSALFYYLYDDIQFIADDPVRFQGGVDNAPEAEVLGIEIEMDALLGDSVEVNAGFSWLDTEFTVDHLALDPVVRVAAAASGVNTAAGFIAVAENINGNPLPKAPEYSFRLSATHMANFVNGWELNSTVTFTWRDEYASRVFGTGNIDVTPDYHLLNLSFNAKPPASRWGLGLLLTNVTDEDAVNSRWTNSFGVRTTHEEYVPPLQVIGRVSYEF